MKKTLKAIATSAVMMATASLPAFADTVLDKNKTTDQLGGTIGNLTITGLISGIIRLLVIAAAVVFFFMLVIGGIKWIMSGGDKGKTEEARNQITAALVGLVVVFSAWAIATLIKTLFGVDIFNLEIKPLA